MKGMIYWTGAGPMLSYRDGVLNIDDLNPEQHLHWRIGRGEMLVIGLRFIWAAIKWPWGDYRK